MRPAFDVVAEHVEPPSADPALSWKLDLGRMLAEAVDLYKARKELRDINSVVHAQALPDRLSPDQFDKLRRHQTNTLDLDYRKRHFRTSDPRTIYQGIAYLALQDLLMRDPSICSVLNIGCNYAYMDWLLAQQFEQIEFIGVDVNDDIPQVNADLRRTNTRHYAGYALEMLEKGTVGADVTYFSSTATVIRNPELRKYVELLRGRSKYVLFSEPVWTLPGGEVMPPARVHPLDSEPAFIQRDSLSGAYGYLCYIHNYAGILDQGGFDVIQDRFFHPGYGSLHWAFALGQNRETALWA